MKQEWRISHHRQRHWADVVVVQIEPNELPEVGGARQFPCAGVANRILAQDQQPQFFEVRTIR
jgi:hypothetical protein